MRKFTLTIVRSGRVLTDRTLSGAAKYWSISDKCLNALADLQVGKTYVDSDGDTWERVE